MNIVTLLPFIVLIGAMFLMTRSAKKKQQAAANMRNQMQPGTGVRTIGGMYATVKEIHDDSVLLEVAPGVHAIYAKNAIGAVLEDEEYNRIINGLDPIKGDEPVVPDDASSLTGVEDATPVSGSDKGDTSDKGDKIDLGKGDAAADEKADAAEPTDVKDAKGASDTQDTQDAKDAKKDGGADAK